jgi:hypothetical protein
VIPTHRSVWRLHLSGLYFWRDLEL